MAQILDCKGNPFENFWRRLSTNEKPRFQALDQSQASISGIFYSLTNSKGCHCASIQPVKARWKLTGSHGFSCLPLDYQLITTWLPLEDHLKTTWLPIDFHLPSTWIPLDCHLTSTWMPLDYHLTATWIPLNFHLTTTWLPLDFYLTTTQSSWLNSWDPVNFHCALTGWIEAKWQPLELVKEKNVPEMEACDWSRARNRGFSLVESLLRQYSKGVPLRSRICANVLILGQFFPIEGVILSIFSILSSGIKWQSSGNQVVVKWYSSES